MSVKRPSKKQYCGWYCHFDCVESKVEEPHEVVGGWLRLVLWSVVVLFEIAGGAVV